MLSHGLSSKDITDKDRERILKRVFFGKDDECWMSSFARTKKEGHQYPMAHLGKRMRNVSQIMYVLYNGDINAGMFVLHSCDNPNCVNPNHLRVGTPRDNVIDREKRKRNKKSLTFLNKNKTHCLRGHKFTHKNTIKTIRNGNLKRACRICKNLTRRLWRKRKKLDVNSFFVD